MSVELRPMGVHCNIACQYCYQNPIREAGNVSLKYDLDLMKRAIEEEGGPFTIFGGEPLLLPMDDLENLMAWGFEKYGANRIQTNGTIMGPEYIALFKRYKVKVGVSVDGPDELNDVRWSNNLERTRMMSDKTHDTIATLCAEGLAPSIIITLHRVNGAGSAFVQMNAWVKQLEAMGVRIVRLHVLEVDDPDVGDKYQLTHDEQIACFQNFARLERDELTHLRFDIFQEARDLLTADDVEAGCVWHACDPMTTKAVRGVEGLGQRSNCGRTNKDGIEYVKSPSEGFERYRALYETPHADGGCQGCRFFLVCKGQCPGTAIDGDWRNRSESCRLWTALFTQAEADMVADGLTPLSQHPKRERLEKMLISYWSRGQNPSLAHLVSKLDTDMVSAPDKQTFARLSWTSARAQAVWEGRLKKIRTALNCAGFLGVQEGLFDGFQTFIPLMDFPQIEVFCTKTGITLDRAEIVARPGARSPLLSQGPLDALWVDCILGTPQIGPEVEASDVLFALARPVSTDDIVPLPGHWSDNPCWLPLGLDTGFTTAPRRGNVTTEDILSLARNHGFDEEISWLSEVFSWPVEWTAKSGIAEMRSAVVKVIHDCPFDPQKRALRCEGDLLPLEGAQGHAYPFRQPIRRVISGSSNFKRGLATIGEPQV